MDLYLLTSLRRRCEPSWRAKTESFPPSSRKFLQIGIYGGGGNRTRVRGRTEQSVYERSPCFISPDGRFTDNLPTGQPS